MTNRKGAVTTYGLVSILFAMIFIFAPILIPGFVDVEISRVASIMLIAVGIFLFLLGGAVITYTNLYNIASASSAFVRMGTGGERVVIDGGALVVPVFHSVTRVTLSQIRINVIRKGEDALLTKDFLRANIEASFFLFIPKSEESVLQAARSLSMDTGFVNAETVKREVEEKFVSALRSVAADMEITTLLANRVQFQDKVKESLAGEITSNGLVLDTVTISGLDQTPYDDVQSDKNIFDAQGRRKAAEIIQNQMVETQRIELDAQQQMKADEVQASQQIYERDIELAKAAAERDRQIKSAQAEAQQAAATVEAQQRRLARTAEIETESAIAVSEVSKQKAQEVAEQDRLRSVETAAISREESIEVANRKKQTAIAISEQERALAEAEQLAAEAERQRREQEVATVAATAEADRRAAISVTAAKADAERNKVDEQTKADVSAYTVVAKAQADQEAAQRLANAKRIAAEADAAAETLRAKASADAATLQAEGERAIQLVPVSVQREQVNVEQARVAVLRTELEAKSEFEGISRDLQIQMAQIEANKEIGIEMARAQVAALQGANIQLFGTPEQVSSMMRANMNGQQFAATIDSFVNAMPSGIKRAAGDAINNFMNGNPESNDPDSQTEETT